ncbi:response regulator [Thermodesulfobacteriota bacterium]
MERILIIDDEVHVRETLRRILEKAGYEVMEAPDGEVGIKLYKEQPADLIITDMIMPEKDGMDTIMELRKDYPQIKIIAVSGGGKIGPYSYLMLAQRFGAEKILSKPVRRQKLLDTVREVLDS